MAFIETIPPEAAEGAVAAMYQRQQTAWGYIPNYAKACSLRPEVLARWGQLLAEIRRPMDKRRFELITFVAALELDNSACALVHGKALREFFTDAQILAIAAGRGDTILSKAEQAMVTFARQTAIDATRITAGQVAALRQHGHTDAEIFDIAATAAGRAFFAKLLDALGVLPDSPLLALDESMRRALTVGRPIDEGPCVTMPAPQPVAPI
ncbi:MAG: carboxymuconolactone decarboxylase family protein [Burkholderiales bacterium]